MCSPLLPGLTDTLEALDTMARRAKAVDASFFVASPLFLKPCSKETYLAFVREHFPALESLYRFRFDGRAFVAEGYRKRIEALVNLVIRKHGLDQRSVDVLRGRDSRWADRNAVEQAELWPERKPPERTSQIIRSSPEQKTEGGPTSP